jgi:hypothetical protein
MHKTSANKICEDDITHDEFLSFDLNPLIIRWSFFCMRWYPQTQQNLENIWNVGKTHFYMVE